MNAALVGRIQRMAHYDVLTDLPNRRLFQDRVDEALWAVRSKGATLSLFFVDLDRFKHVNDTLGHDVGDELIRQVGQRLTDTLRRQDTVARLGGDEFAVMLPGLSDQEAIEQLARRALARLSAPYDLLGNEVFISASIGVAIAPAQGDTYDELLKHADSAMYRSKESGRNTFHFFDPSEALARQAEVGIESDLHHALDRGELFVYYQPIVHLATGAVTGLEALCRWQHPSLGLLEPDSFIPVAEQSELVARIDEEVLAKSTLQVREWHDNGMPALHLAVNISSRDLIREGFADTVGASLAKSGLAPELLHLEVTERVVLDDGGAAMHTVADLNALGVHLVLDDFGTGTSTLSRIGTIPVFALKIDQSFVQGLGRDANAAPVVRAITTLAEGMGISCVAEGVETGAQRSELIDLGCRFGQGFLFGAPLPAADVPAFVASHGGSATEA